MYVSRPCVGLCDDLTIYLFPAHPHPPTRFSPKHLLRRCSFGGFFSDDQRCLQLLRRPHNFCIPVGSESGAYRATGSESNAYLGGGSRRFVKRRHTAATLLLPGVQPKVPSRGRPRQTPAGRGQAAGRGRPRQAGRLLLAKKLVVLLEEAEPGTAPRLGGSGSHDGRSIFPNSIKVFG